MDEKALKIIGLFQEGKDKHEIAKQFGYKDYKGMQVYMKRHGYQWNDEIMNYQSIYNEQEETDKDNSMKSVKTMLTKKVAAIIAMLNKEKDIKIVARKLNFESHRKMAEYMKSKGYKWNHEKKNYEYVGSSEEVNKLDGRKTIKEKACSNNSINTGEPQNNDNCYNELFEFLNQNKDRLTEILLEESVNSQTAMPRYIITGVNITKSVHMVCGLDQIIRDFSQEKNISQKEMFQVAMIEFFKKYGYKREIEALMIA